MQNRWTRSAIALLVACTTLGGCASGGAGKIGDILGSVLGGQTAGQPGQGQGGQTSGTITGVDTRTQQIGLQTANGQTVALAYDNQTRVVYQNQQYPVTALERGDRVTVRVQQTSGGGYYTDLVQVDQSVQTSTGSTSQNVQTYQGTVGQVDLNAGWFTLNTGNAGTLTISMPYNPTRNDVTRFQNLRRGETVRLYGVPLNNTRVELRQFY